MAMQNGDRGPEVQQLQKDLSTAGYPCGAVDGIFGRQTTEAVKSFQRTHGLTPDGKFGPDCAARMQIVLEQDPGHDEDQDDIQDPEATDRPAVPANFPDFFDNWDGELARQWRPDFYEHEGSGRTLPFKGRPTAVDLAERTHVCMHVTAAEYGTSPQRRGVWQSRIEADEISDELLSRYDDGSGSTAAKATRMALHERFWKVTYHWVGLLNGDVLFNNAPSRYTYHGNRSNRFAIGFSAEAKVPGREARRTGEHTVVDDHFIETNREALRLAITTSRDAGAPIRYITAHRAFSMTREGDPGEAVWREVALPVAHALDLEVDYDLVDGGRSIPRDWDPSSPFDWSGKRIA